jgi:predicted amino acid dehydrogenase
MRRPDRFNPQKGLQAMDKTKSTEACLGKFAFLIHPTSLEDLYASGPKSFSEFTAAQRQKWEAWIASWSQRRYEPGIAYHLPALRSRAGGYAEGWLIAIPLTPNQMMRLKPQDRKQLLDQCVQIAKELEVDMLGLGAFTSIISRSGSDLVGCGVNLTTGNSLTAMVAAESLKIAARQTGKDLARGEVGLIGAAGSVGRLACKRLAAECRRLTLFGNPTNPGSMQKLKALAGELYQDGLTRLFGGAVAGVGGALLPYAHSLESAYRASLTERSAQSLCRLHDAVAELAQASNVASPVTVTIDLERELPRMEFVVSATSQGKAFIDAHVLAHGAVVCDAARPADVVADIRELRPDVFVYEGGLMRLPQPISFGRRNVIGCPPGVNLACLSETMVLAMSGVRRDMSIGAEPSLADAEEVFRLARGHGFEIFVPEAERTAPASREPRSAELLASAA